MDNTKLNQELSFFLPKLKSTVDIKASTNFGEWDSNNTFTFDKVASSLDYEVPGIVTSVSSVPTMWARPLLMEMALYNQAHPLHTFMVEQWQGMLAAIALAEVRHLPLKAQLIELEKLKNENEDFADSLFKLLPDYNNALYKLDGKNPWRDVYIFLWNEKPVGMTSPSTLVVPSSEGEWSSLPWWRKQDGIWRLHSPQAYLDESEQPLLRYWLEEHLSKELKPDQNNRKAINVILKLISDFRDSLVQSSNQRPSLTDNSKFFGIPLDRGVLKALNRPVKALQIPSCVRLIPSSEKEGKVQPLLIIDPEIADLWKEEPHKIWVHGDKTLASIQMQELRTTPIEEKTGKRKWDDIEWIEPDSLFLPEFVFLDKENILEDLFRSKTKSLTFKDRHITPLLPLNPILLDYFTPEDLIDKVEILSCNENSRVTVTLELPLAGLQNGNPSKNCRFTKDYFLKEENILEVVPVLEVWPNLRTKGWKEYYVFYYDTEYGDQTFQIYLPEAKEVRSFKEGKGSYQMTHLEKFPSVICCENTDHKLIGIILLKTPEEIQSRDSWQVGVDFGTSFTNVYVNTGNKKIEQLPLESLLLKVTESEKITRFGVLLEYFIPEEFLPKEKPLPLSSVLTTKGSVEKQPDKLLFDGRIYIPDGNTFEPQDNWIKTNLKWSKENLFSNKLFLKNLAIHISAIAAKKGIKTIDWRLSYPSAFSLRQTNEYKLNWKELTKELQSKTGIIYNPDTSNEDYFSTESLAAAQYFRDKEGYRLVKATCIDMGGGTADISIWEDNQLVHQCSVQFAGRDLFSQFLEMNFQFVERRFLKPSLKDHKDLEEIISNWKKLSGAAFNAKFDVYLRNYGDNWLKDTKSSVEEEQDFQGFTRLTAIGMAGLYYYVGILLKVLHQEKKYNCEDITRVYMGGNGSRLLNWLAEGGQFNKNSEVNRLLSRMLSKGSGFEDIKEITILSQNPKDEVACGLVLNETKLKELNENAKALFIAGETFQINGQVIEGKSYSDIKNKNEEIGEFKIPTLVNLPQFLYDFNVALKDLNIKVIIPLKNNYHLSPELEKNSWLWREVNDELRSLLLNFYENSVDSLEPPFILGLKALLKVLAKQWAEQ